ncbi:bacteriocin [Clostridium botulinum]|uniref:Bacteriocin n=1 Tax=Clostridium botulinum (strain Hall / ATCC 3502 / NCTC 13319 / Type A) TaxID=441771 RepID=A5I836_CLOBH|nr:bacteriocin [Clostridium botulinum]NFL70826.1 bacteriocin [Clostridium botulinum]NFQ55166.1 bacteriocin [Clostridium botulinum]NFT48096.1 bacteriocin [Clostridium botulinum]QGT45386.1 hypothetical protein GJ703_03667 [Clostridium botulinum]CAL81549.1 bacteriocin [Clostridium botulinum A str. ATCC 3502]
MEKPKITNANMVACSGNPYAAIAMLGLACGADFAYCQMPSVSDLWGSGTAKAL